jgi:hypothetical protein
MSVPSSHRRIEPGKDVPGVAFRVLPAPASLACGALLAVTACAPRDEEPSVAGDEAASVVEATPVADAAGLPAFTETIPEADVPALDREMALTLVAMPLSCLDRPHEPPRNRRTYLDTLVASRVPGYEDTRAFYGCWDWHSAVNSTWAMVRIYKEFPDIPVSGLIEEKLDDHLSGEALQGELAFFEDSRSFERPYGWAWLLELQAELSSWDHPDAEAWAGHVAPLAALFSERMVEHLEDLKIPSRSGAHSNTAFALAMMLEAARATGDDPLEQAVEEAALRFFGDDVGCPTAYEPWGSDFLSPCLEEAALMAAVLDADTFRAWLDDFLPPVTSRAFRPLTSPTDPDDVVAEMERVEDTTSSSDASDEDGPTSLAERREAAERRFLASASHLIGLAFIRADALNRIVAALPEDDPRIPALRKIARLHGSRGFDAMFDADYAGSHWIGTFALKYLLTERDRIAADATVSGGG